MRAHTSSPRCRRTFFLFIASLAVGARCGDAAPAPLAILTDSHGTVQIARGGRTSPAQAGAQLFAGDTIRVLKGDASIYYLSRAPQSLKSGQSANIATARLVQAPSAWRSVYAGLASGFSRRGEKRYATVRNDVRAQLVTPVETRVYSSRPIFLWLPPVQNAYVVDYQVEVRFGNRILWEGVTRDTSLHYPAKAPRLVPGTAYIWRVTPRRKGAGSALELDSDQQSQDAGFRIATAEQRKKVDAQLKSLPQKPSRLMVAATFANNGMSAEAIQTLLFDGDFARAALPPASAPGEVGFLGLDGAALLRDGAERAFLHGLLPRSQGSSVAARFAGYLAVADLRTQFDTGEAAATTAKPDTQEHAVALQKAGRLAGDIAWAAFEARLYDTAMQWFDRRAALRKQAYESARSAGEADATANEAKLKQARQELNGSLDAHTRQMLEMQSDVYSNTYWMSLAKLYALARENSDPASMLKYAEAELAVRRWDLELLRKDNAPPEIIHFKNVQIARALEEVGAAHTELFEFEPGEKYYREALTLRRSLAATADQRVDRSLSALANLYMLRAEMPRARDYFAQAIESFDASSPLMQKALGEEKDATLKSLLVADNVTTHVMLLNNLGLVYGTLGDYQRARSHYRQSLDLLATLPSEGVIGGIRSAMSSTTRNNLAEIEDGLGNTDAAMRELTDVVAIRRTLDDVENTGIPLLNIANLYYEKRDMKEALRYTSQARMILLAARNLRAAVEATVALSVLSREAGDLPQAAGYADEAIAMATKTGDYSVIAAAIRALVGVRVAQKQYEAALRLLEEAARADERVSSPRSRASTLHWRGRALEGLGRNEDALTNYAEAIKISEDIRTTVPSEKSFAEKEYNYQVYRSIVNLLIKMQRPEEAFDYLTRAKSQTLHDSLRLSSIKSNNKALQSLLDRASGLQNRLRTVGNELAAESGKTEQSRDERKIETMQLVLADTQREFLLVSKQIRDANPNFDRIMSVRPAELKQAQSSIPDDTILVQYAPLGDRLHIFLVTRDRLKIVVVSAKPQAVEERIGEFRKLMDTSLREAASGRRITLSDWSAKDAGIVALRKNLTTLYSMVIAPIEKEIADKRVVAIIPTGSFYYLPVHALAREEAGGPRFFIEDKQVTYLSAADVMAVVRKPDASKLGSGLTAYGNPEGAGLAHALDEVKSIAGMIPGSAVLSGREVTKRAVLEPRNLNRRFLHFATHGVLNAQAPDQSYIQLAASPIPEDSRLTVGEVYGLDLATVDLVTLSACQTALGERHPDGRDITTLADAFSTAGAATVTASLWSVDDLSTQELMVEFYRQLAGGKSKAAAMQSAQLKVMKDPRYRHPFYWAPFILMGDWR